MLFLIINTFLLINTFAHGLRLRAESLLMWTADQSQCRHRREPPGLL